MTPELSEKVCLWVLFLFCIAFASVMLKALLPEPSTVDLISVFSEGYSLPLFWGSIITPALVSIAIASAAIRKKCQKTPRSVVLAYFPAIALSLIMATIGVPIVGVFFLLALSWLLYGSLKQLGSSS